MQVHSSFNSFFKNDQIDFSKSDAVINKMSDVGDFLKEPAAFTSSYIYFQVQTFSYNFEPKENPTLTLSDIGYTGKPFEELTQDDAKELVAPNGFFGIDQTSQRLSDFVLAGAGDDVSMLKAGREGIIQGFKEAEKIWGETLPEISYKSLEAALEKIDAKLQELGSNVIDFGA